MYHTEYVHEVDAGDRIVSVNPGWLEFARQASASELTDESLIGRSLYDFIAGEETKRLYRMLLARVRQARREVRVPFRCDDARVRRFMELRIAPGHRGRVEFTGRLLREEKRANVPLFDPTTTRSRESLQVCTWCKKVRAADGQWLEVEDAIARLGLFEAKQMPSVLHHVCAECENLIRHTIDGVD